MFALLLSGAQVVWGPEEVQVPGCDPKVSGINLRARALLSPVCSVGCRAGNCCVPS